MSRTKKSPTRRRVAGGRPEAPEVGAVRSKRGNFGRTEKIRRRNRKTWTRLGSKRRRRLDKSAASEDP